MSKNNFQERLRKMEDTKQRFSIRKFSIGAASVLIGLTIFGMGNETVHAAEQPAQNQNGVNKEEKAKQEVSVDPKANTAQFEKVSAVKEEKPDPTPAKEQNAQDSASTQTSQPAVDSVKQNAKKTQQVGNDKTALATTINAKKTRQVGNDKAALATTINAEKTQQAGNDKAVLATTITLNEPQSSVVEITESKATVQDKNSTTVKTAQELIDAIQKGTANTINIGANIDLGTISSYTNTNISNKRNIIIQSADGKQYTVDFSGYGFNMYSSNYGVTFKNLDLYGRSYYGIVRSAGSYTFDNVNYIGAELIYTDPGYNTTVNFDGNVTAYSVGSYTAPLNGKLRLCQGGNNQQVIQFADGKNTINFNSGSNVTLTTTNSNVVEVDKGTTTINVKNGAQVSLNPHTQIFTEQHRMRMDGIARGIASDGNTTLNIDQGGNLDINLTKNTKDWYLSGALYLNSGATINVNGNLNINSNGKPYYRSQGWDDPVYINSNATINVNGGSFKVNATNMGDDYKGSIVTSNGKIAINHHGTFDVTGDGAKATGVSLGNGSTFTSTQPELFNISMPDGATAIKNGKVQFKGVKTSTGGQPIGEIDIIYDSNGTPKVTTVTSYDKDTTTATRTAGNNAKNKINLVAAGKEVDLKGITFTKDADGNYIMSGNANTADNNGAYVYISVNGTVHQVAPTDSQTLYTVGPTGGPTSSQVPYTAETGADGEFSVNLGKLKDTDQVSLYAAKDFVTSDKDTKTVSEWMTSFYRDQLQKLVDEAPTVEGGSNYINATDSLKTAYANAISDGSAFLQNPSATSEQLEAAATAITTAKTALNGDLNKVKQDLEAAVDAAPDFENTSATYYNAASAKQQAYNTAISDGSEALKAQNPTVESLTDALNKINEAKSALDGQPTDKQALQAAVNKSKDVKDSNNYANADQNAKTAYDNAVTAAQGVLDNSNATQAQVTQALQDLNTANGKLNGDAKTEEVKQALEAAVKDAPNVRNTPAYYNAASAKQQAYNTAISDGSEALKAQNPTVESLTTALNKINEAKSALDGKATDTSKLKAAVDNANTVKASNDYKDASADDQKQYDDAVKAGQQLLDPTTAPSPLTQADVDRAAKAITDAQSALTTSATTNVKDAKGKATADLTNAVDAAKKAIDQDTNLTEDERNAAKAQVDSDASAAKEAINKATTNDAVTYAATAGKVTIDKTVANAAIDNAAAGRNKAIDGSSLTDEEKNGIKDQVAQAVKTAKDIISAADTEQAVTTAQKNGVAAIAGIKVPTESATKTAADKAIDEALANKQAEINKSTTLTDEEKANLNQQAQNAANTAKQNIANAKTDSAVATAQDNGVAAIDGIKVSANSTAKDQAKSNITDAADKAKQTIDQDNNLTNDQKQAAKAQVDADAKTAQEAINKATTNDDVTSATNTGKLAIDKAVANAAIDNAVAGKKAEISNAKDLSSDDVKALNNEVDQAANDAKNAISSATTEKAVKTAQTDGVDKINAIDVATTAAKDKAKSDIDQTANDAKKAIDDNKDLTDDQKTAAKDQIDQDATKAKDNINNAKTDKDVEDANNAGQLAIAKDGAKAAIQGALNKKLNEIDSASALTSDEKAKLTNDANTAATNANKAIDAATTPIEVTSAQTAGIQDIENVKVPAESTTKDQAKSNITDAADKAKQTIDQDNNLTNDQKQAAKDQVDTDAKNAQDAIDNAKTDADVNNAADNGKIAIDKTVADAAIDNAVAGKIKDVKAPLTTDEQKTLTDLIKETGENAKQNIANATTPAEVTIAQDAGVNAIDQINVPTTSPVKDAADKAIDEALKNKTAAINKADNITDQEKHSLIDKVNKAADDATSAIKNATTDNAVKDAETKGLNEINGVTIPTLAEKQQAANVAIDQAAKAKKAEIAKALQAGNIDQAKADSLNTEVDNDVTNAMKAIANATTNAAVVVAQNDGIHKIKAIKVPSSTYNPDITNNTSTGSGDTDSTSTKPAEEATLKLILTHNAYIYNKDYQITYKDNKRVVLKKGTQIIALDNGKKYLIKGKEFYRIGDNQYVKVSNTISYYYLVHNSFLYNKHGKTIKRNGKRILVRKGVRLEANKVKVVKINGKKFYKVGKSTYIKFRNVKLSISPNN